MVGHGVCLRMASDSPRPWKPETGDYDGLLDIAGNRKMVYRYEDDEPVPDEDVERILEVARWAPSGHNTQPWEFVVLRDGDDARDGVVDVLKRQREWLSTVDESFPAHGRVYLDEAPVLVVLVGDVRYRAYFPDVGEYGVGETTVTEAIYYESIGCCMQNIHLAAKALGYGTVHLTVRHKYHDELRDLLGLPDTHLVHDVVPIGVPSAPEDRSDADRESLEDLVHWGRFDGDAPSDEAFVRELTDTTARVRRMHGPPKE